jgi:1,4-alpha-glucan branching enzyme
VDCTDVLNGVVALLRHGGPSDPPVLVVLNLTPVLRDRYRIGVPLAGRWRELLNGDAREYGGDGAGNLGGVEAQAVGAHGRSWSVELTLPGLTALYLVPEG